MADVAQRVAAELARATSKPGSPREQVAQTTLILRRRIKRKGLGDAPVPIDAKSPKDLNECMNLLLVWAGNPSLRELERMAGGHGALPRGSVSDMLRRCERLPKLAVLHTFVAACGNEEYWPLWLEAWRRIQHAQRVQMLRAQELDFSDPWAGSPMWGGVYSDEPPF
jgi:hypothetical protein